MSIYNLLVIVCWAFFLVVWLVSSVFTKKNKGGSGLRNNMLIRAALAIVVIAVFHRSLGKVLSTLQIVPSKHPTSGVIAVFLAALGIGFATWARMHLGKNWGMPMTVKEKPDLVTSGPYAYVRHPIYTGVLIAILGSVFLSGVTWIVVFAGAFVYFYYSAKKEEQTLIKEFPRDYPSYMKRTKRLIPFLY